MTKQQKPCNHIKKNGEHCKNPRFGKSEYCKMHIVAHHKRITGIIMGSIAIIGLFLGIISYISDQKMNQKLTQLMDNINQTQSENFQQTFPSGYQIFSITNDGILLGPIVNIEDWGIDWDSVKVLEVTSSSINIRLPDMYYKPLDYTFTGNAFEFSKGNIGSTFKLRGWLPDDVSIQLVSEIENAVICILGLEPRVFSEIHFGLINYDQTLDEEKILERDLIEYSDTIQLFPNDIDLLYKLGAVYFQLGQFQFAVDKFDEVIISNTDYVLAYCNRAKAYTMLYMDNEANNDIIQALDLGYDQSKLLPEIDKLKKLRVTYKYPDDSIINDILSTQ